MPKPKWKIEKPVEIKLKLLPSIRERYKNLLKAKYPKGRTMQEDLETYINNLLS